MTEKKLLELLKSNEKNQFIKNKQQKKLKNKEEIDVGSCPGLLLVKEGKLRVYLVANNGREITLFNILPGEFCIMSSSCIIGQISFNLLIESVEDSKVEIIPKHIIETLKIESTNFNHFLLELIGKKMSIVLELIDDILVKKIDVRIGEFLLTNGDIYNMTHEEIANHIGSSREVISRSLKNMQLNNIVELKRKSVLIKDLDALKKLIN